MLWKACERYIFHVMAYAYFFEMPKIRTLSVSLSFLFEFSSRALFLKCPIFICSIFLKCPIFDSFCSIILKCPIFDSFLFENWAFQNNRTYENRAFQKNSTWWEFEQKRERNWKYSNKINEHMPSREKFIFHMLSRAFHNTSRISPKL